MPDSSIANTYRLVLIIQFYKSIGICNNASTPTQALFHEESLYAHFHCSPLVKRVAGELRASLLNVYNRPDAKE